MSASVLIWMISSFRWEILFKVILFFLKSSEMYGIYRVGDVTTATQMVWMVVELHLLVYVALLEVILCSSRQSSCLRSLQAAVIAAEALAIDIVVVVLAIVRHCKGCLLFSYFICHIYIHFQNHKL